MDIIRSVPSNGSNDVSPNITLYVSLSKNLDSSTVNAGTVLLTNLDTNEVLRSEITLNKNTISILPSIVMDEFTSYRLDLIGADADSPGGCIVAADSTYLDETLSISFQTSEYVASAQTIVPETTTFSGGSTSGSGSESSGSGCSYAPTATTPNNDADGDGVTDGYQVVEDASNDMTYAYENDLYVVDATPCDGASDILPEDVNAESSIVIQFSRPIDEETVASALTIKQHPIGGLRFAGTSEEDIAERAASTSNDLFCITNRRDYINPSYDISVSNEYLTIDLTDDPVRLNSEVNVTISRKLQSTAGDSGNQVFLKETSHIDFTTVLFPLYVDVEEIRLELAELSVTATDEIINRLVLVNSIAAWNTACQGFEFCNPPGAAIGYAKAKTALDIFDMSQTRGIMNPGISKSLGDFSISYKGNARYRTPKEDELAQDVKDAASWLKRTYCTKRASSTAVKGRTAATTQGDFRRRTWRKTGWTPNRANTKSERQYRLPGSGDYWS